MEFEGTWIYLALSGLSEMMVNVPSEAAKRLFDGDNTIKSFQARYFTTIKVRKESKSDMEVRAKAYKIEMPVQETIIEAFPWIVEQEEAVKGDAIIYMHSVAWVRQPCDELIAAAIALWKKSNILQIHSNLQK